MKEELIKKLREEFDINPEFFEKLEKARNEKEFISILRQENFTMDENGFEILEDELREERELSENELANVTGGWYRKPIDLYICRKGKCILKPKKHMKKL